MFMNEVFNFVLPGLTPKLTDSRTTQAMKEKYAVAIYEL